MTGSLIIIYNWILIHNWKAVSHRSSDGSVTVTLSYRYEGKPQDDLIVLLLTPGGK